jgi:hypothetical protein
MGGDGKGRVQDNSAELYRQQQADLAAQRQALEDEEKSRKLEEQKKRDDLRSNMLAQRDVLSADDEEGDLLKATLG